MITQRRRTAGIHLFQDTTKLHVDPGPGALIFSNWAGLSPQKLDGVIVTHCHPDHYSDAEVLIEAMSRGGTKKRGALAAPRSVLQGNGLGPSISTYHQGLVETKQILESNASFEVGILKLTGVEAHHSDPHTMGLIIETSNVGSVGYTSDTGYFPELGELYRGMRLLLVCSMRPRGHPLHLHLSTDDALQIVEQARPECVILTHFGMRMLNSSPDAEASFIEKQTDIPVIAAKDGIKITLAESIEVAGPRKRDGTRKIEA